MSVALDELRERIKALYPELSPAMKRVAKISLDDPLEITLQPLRTVADRSGTGTTTLIRFARLLGYDTYGAFRDCFRSELRRGASNYSERGRALLGRSGAGSVVGEIRATAEVGLGASFETNSPALIEAFAASVMGARHVYIVGQRSAYAPAFYLQYLLAMLRPGIRFVENRFGMLLEEIRDAGPEDVAIAISFEPYAQGTIDTARLLKETGAAVLAISDSSASPLAGIADEILEVATASPSFYISFTPLICVIEAVAAVAALRAGDHALAALKKGDDLRGRPGTYWAGERSGDRPTETQDAQGPTRKRRSSPRRSSD